MYSVVCDRCGKPFIDEYNKGGATHHILLWKAMGNIEDALNELED